MRHLQNTLFVTSEDAYLSLDGENVVVQKQKKDVGRFPLHTLCAIFSFSYAGASPALMGACAKRQINLAFFTPRGRFLARTCGETHGNVLLRRTQYRIADDPIRSCEIARSFIVGKIYNARWVLSRTLRDHALRVDAAKINQAIDQSKKLLMEANIAEDLAVLRGIEGVAASSYFNVFDEMILMSKESFFLRTRNRRPPLDNVNALLSFAYSLLAKDCASALEGVGLDSFVGFMHRDKPGRTSLSLDLMEELRPCFADRFVITLINNRVVSSSDFQTQENGAVYLDDKGKKAFLQHWQQKKQDMITHPFLEEKLPWGLIPHVQALLLARYLRGDLDRYPPFLWK